MGSGLILLVIVGAWLAVLVPMALRNTDVTGSLGSVDKFHDAMRVLSRRDSSSRAEEEDEPVTSRRITSPGERAAAGSRTGAASTRAGAASPAAGPASRVVARLRSPLAGRHDREPLSAAARRRRVLLLLVVAAVGTLVGGLLGPSVVLVAHGVVDLLLVAFVVHLRRTAAARAEREWRTAMGSRPAAGRPAAMGSRPAAARPAAGRTAPATRAASGRDVSHVTVAAPRPSAPARRLPVHVAGIPDRMPARPVPAGASPAARSAATAPGAPVVVPEQLPAARGAQGEAWSPVPVPAPTYLSAPVAPRRVVDLARPGGYADGLADAERELGIVDSGPQLDEILDRRRAVNDW